MPLPLDIWSRNKLYKIGCQSKIVWRNNWLSDHWAVEPMGCRTNGLSDQWAVGILGRTRGVDGRSIIQQTHVTLQPYIRKDNNRLLSI